MGPCLTVVHLDRKEEGWEISLCSGWPASSGTLLADGREGGVTNGRSLSRKSALPRFPGKYESQVPFPLLFAAARLGAIRKYRQHEQLYR